MLGGDVADLLVVEVQAGHRVVALRRLRLLLDAERAPGVVELDHAVALGVVHVVGEDRGAAVAAVAPGAAGRAGRGRRRCCRRAPASSAPPPTKRLPRMKACARPSGLGCTQYADRRCPTGAVAEQRLEARDVLRRADQQDLADAGQHQRRQRVVDHRLVVHRQQLLAHRQRRRMQPRAGAAGEDDALAASSRHRARCFRSGLRRACGRRRSARAAASGRRSRAACACRGANCAAARAGVGNALVGTGSIRSGATLIGRAGGAARTRSTWRA